MKPTLLLSKYKKMMNKTIIKTTLHILIKKKLGLKNFNLKVAKEDGLSKKTIYFELWLNKMGLKIGPV